MAKSPTRSGSGQPRAAPSARRRQAEPAGYGFLTVGQTARILGVSPSTLRLWENVGLVSPVRSNGRYRLYSPELLKVLKRIKYLRDVQRLNVPGIKRELGGDIKPRARAHQRPLGPLLRRMRKRREMGLAEAASHAGISAGFLSSLERSQANASVATLQRLATSYGTTVMELFQTPRTAAVSCGRTNGACSTCTPASGWSCCRAARRCCSPCSSASPRWPAAMAADSHQGEEFIYMISGTLEMWLDELQCFVLQAGDSFWFESTHGHRWFNPGDTEAALLWINTPPTF